MKNNQLIDFYSHKLNSAQQNYMMTEHELLSIIQCLKEFQGILLNQWIKVNTDHKNLVTEMSGSTSQKVTRW